MRENTHPGKFIVVEGLDGSGNSTQADRLRDKLKEEGQQTYLTKEPTDSLIGGLIRSRLRGEWETSPECLQLLFTADRAHHLHREILPLLRQGAFVICDRYFLSTLAYGALDIDLDWLIELNKEFIVPDLTFLMNVSPKVCVNRIAEDRHDFELFEKENELEAVWKNYEELIDRFDDIVLVGGERDINTVTRDIFTEVKNRFL